MRQAQFFLIFLLLACGCEEELLTIKQTPQKENQVVEQTLMAEDVVYDEITGVWLYKAGDPYTLDNAKKVYTSIISGNSRFEITRSQIDDLIASGEPQATHYSLKFYPRTEAEQWYIMNIEGLQYSFYPFEYLPLTEEQLATLSPTRSQYNTLSVESRYSVTYTDLVTSKGSVEPQTVHLPVIYATWPVENQLPADLEYEIIEELFFPNHKNEENCSFNAVMEMELSPIVPPWWGDPITPNPPVFDLPIYKGRIMHYDDVLGVDVPISGVTVFMRYGSKSVSAETDDEGYFEIFENITSLATVTMYLSTNKFWISTLFEGATDNNSMTYTEVIGSAGDFLCLITPTSQAGSNYVTLSSNAPYFETLRAALYYFDGDHELQAMEQTNGLRISVCEEEEEEDQGVGLFYISYSQNSTYIHIYNYSEKYDDLSMMAAVFHELGHFTRYYERGGLFDNYEAEYFISESYACYVADYLIRAYYEMYDRIFAPDELDQSLQYAFGMSDYTPFFIDLFDTFDQRIPVDKLSGFTHEAMQEIAQNVKTWEELKEILRSYVGLYYTAYDLDVYLAYYDKWIVDFYK